LGTDTGKQKENKRSQPLRIADALFSKAQQSVLALIFGQPGQRFYTNEIIKKSGHPSRRNRRTASTSTA